MEVVLDDGKNPKDLSVFREKTTRPIKEVRRRDLLEDMAQMLRVCHVL
jgi:hypothetical protein